MVQVCIIFFKKGIDTLNKLWYNIITYCRGVDLEKIGIIDLGSHTARLILADVTDGGYFRITDQMKASPKIGADMEKDGFLQPARIQETIHTIKMFRKLCDINGIEHIIGIATAAVRKAKNQRSFLDEVTATCGVRLRVLSAEEEALFVYRGVLNTMEMTRGLALEIGGGSTKIIYYNKRTLIGYTTLPFGATLLSSMFSQEEYSPEEQTCKVEEYVTEQVKKEEWLKEIDPETPLIGVGSAFRNICRLSKMITKYPFTGIHNYVMDDANFDRVYDLMKSIGIDKNKKIKGLSNVRSEVLPCSIAFISALKKYIGIKNIVVSGSGLRTGLLFSYAMPSTLDRPVGDIMTYSLRTLNEFLGADKRHIEQVVMIAVQLFKQLRVLHKFPRQYLRMLKVAAYLYDSGKQVDFYNFEKHSGYIILNSNIYGVSHREIVMASFIASNTELEDINQFNWNKYKFFLTNEDTEAVKKMGILLRLAIALDRSKSAVVTNINCDILGDSVILKTELNGSGDLEINSAMTLDAEFRRIFKKNLEVL